jgi:Ca2+-transporting ATPase
MLAEGDRVPADAVVVSSMNLSVDESLLTGESVPVRKTTWDGTMLSTRPGGDDLPFIYSGTLVVRGQGIARVQSTGPRTEMGSIGKALESAQPEKSLLQREVGVLVRNLAIAGISLCALVVVLYGLARGDWLQGLLAGIALAMAMLPEEFPVVLAIFLALGAWRISQRQVLTRRMAVIETLGSATVLCVDKTGTLTLNRMSISRVYADGESFEVGGPGAAGHASGHERSGTGPAEGFLTERKPEGIPERFHAVLEFGILASHRDPHDPMEIAFEDLGDRYLANTEHIHGDWTLVREYPLGPELLAISHVWRSPGGGKYAIASKGAPEAIIDLCHLDEARQQTICEEARSMASEGLRVLGVARAYFGPSVPPDPLALPGEEPLLPAKQHDFDFEFLGLVGLADPIRPAVPAAIEECSSAGVRVVMITGDYPVTAQSIARQIGLTPVDQVITGPELDRMSDQELRARIRHSNIFARVVPEQKLRLVNALKADGQIVAMTGDGVNDAPALKSAHIGIAMGGRGTDVAREAAALVLVDDDFSSIVQALRLGRRIFDNLRKAMAYVFAIHVPIAGMSLIPVLFNWPLVLMPVHIVFLEMIIDPASSIVFEAESEEAGSMHRPPRNPKECLFGVRTICVSLLQGLGILLVVLAVFVLALYRGQGEQDARALSFVTLVLSNLGLILANRSWSEPLHKIVRSPNAAVWWVVGGTLTFLTMALYMPFLRDLFRFSTLHLDDLAICLVAGAVSVTWCEVLKRATGSGRRNPVRRPATSRSPSGL